MRTLVVLIVVALFAAACTRTTHADPGAAGSTPPPSTGAATSAPSSRDASSEIPEVRAPDEPVAVDDLSGAPQFAVVSRTDAVLELDVVGGDHAILWLGPALEPGQPVSEQPALLGSAIAADGTMFVAQEEPGAAPRTWKQPPTAEAPEVFTDGSMPRLSPNDARLYLARGSEVVSFDTVSGEQQWTVDLGEPIESLAVSPDGELLAAHTASEDGPTTWVVPADGTTPTRVMVSGETAWRSPAWRTEVELTVVAGVEGVDGSVRLVSIDPRSFVVADTLGVDLDARSVDWDRSGEWLLVTDFDGVVHWWYDGASGVVVDDEIVSARW